MSLQPAVHKLQELPIFVQIYLDMILGETESKKGVNPDF